MANNMKNANKKLKNIFKASGVAILVLTHRTWRLVFELNLTPRMQEVRRTNSEHYDAIKRIFNKTAVRRLIANNLCTSENKDETSMWNNIIHTRSSDAEITDRHMFIGINLRGKVASINGLVITGSFDTALHDKPELKNQSDDRVLELGLVCSHGNGVGRLLTSYAIAWNGLRKLNKRQRYTKIWTEMFEKDKKFAIKSLLNSLGMKQKHKKYKGKQTVIKSTRMYMTGDVKDAVSAINNYTYNFISGGIATNFEQVCPFQGTGQCV
jgi:hypothetical protein